MSLICGSAGAERILKVVSTDHIPLRNVVIMAQIIAFLINRLLIISNTGILEWMENCWLLVVRAVFGWHKRLGLVAIVWRLRACTQILGRLEGLNLHCDVNF